MSIDQRVETAQASTKDSRKTLVYAGLVLLLAAVLRIYHLGSESLWIDEGLSYRDAEGIVGLSSTRPLYYLLLHFWRMFGNSEFYLRLPSAVLGIVAVGLICVIARRLYGDMVGVTAALMAAISPLQIDHSQEIRMYSLVMALVTAEVVFFLRYIEKSRTRDLVACLLFGCLAFLAHPLTVLMFLVLNLFLLIRFREQRRNALPWFAVQVTFGLISIPFMVVLVDAIHGFGEQWTWRMGQPGALAILRVTRDFNLWRIPEQAGKVVLIGDLYGLMVLAIMGYGIFRAYRYAKWQTSFAVLWLVVPLVVTLVISRFVANVWIVRYMIYASPACYILAALGLSFMPKPRFHALMMVAVLLLPAARLATYYAKPHRPEWRPAVRYVEGRLAEGDVIALYRFDNRFPFEYYYTGLAQFTALGDKELDRRSFEGWDDRRTAEMLSQLPTNPKRIWFYFSFDEETGGIAVEDYVLRHYRVLERKEFVRIRLYLLQKRAG